jgi:hypothetical protein
LLAWQIYLCGGLVSAVGASVAADLFSERDVPSVVRAGVSVFVGVVWPVLLVGLLQLICVGGLAHAVSAAEAGRRDMAQAERLSARD